MLLAYFIVCPWEAVAVGKLAGYLIPSLNSIELYRIEGQPVFVRACCSEFLLTLFLGVLNYRGIRGSATFQGWATNHRSCLVRNRWRLEARLTGRLEHVSRLFCGPLVLDITRVADRALLYDGIRIPFRKWRGSAQGISFARILSRDCAGAFCWLCILCGRDCGRFFCGAMAKLVGKTIRHCRRIWTGYGERNGRCTLS